jgi:sortase (surface protein transpeptidase)
VDRLGYAGICACHGGGGRACRHRREGAGTLFKLESLPMGARIDVRAGNRDVAYRVVARRSYDKQRLPEQLFRTDGAPELVLVTCGGTFRHGAYSHNVVVYAEPAA